ncbi:probable ATP-dependent RNA helicase pitchoune [Belonocnema kinseyi]|uniref:probable ATP-dependent RNA helicase pitchoune n=1 Tax=Belonocnema kinseyi TaxID=2817044 RepID=UPI00143D9B67|nr:probable ATP-dependent RNA helicase pitchoune [Belonocnema kinseyi]
MVSKGELKRKSVGDETIKRKKKKVNKKEFLNSNTKENNTEDVNCDSSTGLELFENSPFSALNGKVCENTLKAIDEMGFINMTKIQALSIPPLLEGKDLVGTAKSSSGKALAYLIPAIELMKKMKIGSRDGTGCIIITPTRELSLQIFAILKELLSYQEYTSALLIDGSDRKTEAQKLSRGANIIVATTGRLLYHLQNTPNFIYKNLQCLILDEADRILETGSENNLKQIINILPQKRQSVFFLKEENQREKLVALTVQKDPVFLNVEGEKTEEIIEGLEEGYVLAPSEKRFHFLLNFLEKNKKKKVIVLFSSCLSAKHHHELLVSLDVPVLSIHGKQKQAKRTAIFSKFCNSSSGILLCAEAATKDLEFPTVDWIVQYDPTEDPKDHIRRIRKAVGGKDAKGKAVLIIRPEEAGFLSHLKEFGVSSHEFKISWNKIRNVQLELEKLISKNYFLNLSGKEAYKAYLKAYDTHHLKQIFDIGSLDLGKVAKSFGFTVPPAVDLSVTETAFDKSFRPEKRLGGGGYGYFKRVNNPSVKKERIKIIKQVGKRKDIRQAAR